MTIQLINKLTEADLCFCVPGELSIIDMVGADGTSVINGETLDQVRERYPAAVIKPLAEFCEAKARMQDRPIIWHETTAEAYEDARCCLPPAVIARGGFLLGEPSDHHAQSGRPRFAAFVNVRGRYYTSNRPLTIAEFRTVAIPTA